MRRGFSLVELLVVIGIIALLIGILLPTLNRARQAARTVKCLSNIRNLCQASFAYGVAFNGFYPPAQWDNLPGKKMEWDFAKDSTGAIVPGMLWQGNTSMAIQQCPSYDGKSNSAGDPYTGYNYNTSYIGRGYGEGPPAKMLQVRNPTQTALFGDGQWASGADKYMRSPQTSPTEIAFSYAEFSAAKAAGTQGFRHQGGTNVGFCDGHAETLQYEPFNRLHTEVASGTGFLSQDNSLYDLQ